jgi:tRNA A37 threonylcarbamoyladenosine modification protein TsaB
MYALAIGKPFIGLTTLEVMAFQSGLRGDILAVIDAHRGQYYVQRFRKMDRMVPLSDALLVDEKALMALAHGAKKAELSAKAQSVAALAYEKWQAGERSFPTNPLYIREPDAKLPAVH